MQRNAIPSAYETINIGEEDEMIINGYMPSIIRLIIFICLIILSGGILLLIISWKPGIRIRITHSKCSLNEAKIVVLIDKFGEKFIEKVEIPPHFLPGTCVHFFHKKIKYIWKNELNQFAKIRGLETEKCGHIYSASEGLTSVEAKLRSQIYGVNSILVEMKPIWKLIIEEITGPFYIYQMFIFTIWMIQLYYQFASCVLLLSIISVSIHVYQTRKQTVALREKVHSESEVSVLRDGVKVDKSSTELVPGDVLILPTYSESFTMECDAVLITGNCTVDESMLTGECVPISKVFLNEEPNILYSPVTKKNNTLFCGTRVLYVQSTDSKYAKAIVIRTGFSTSKGELVRSILFPKQVNYKLKLDLIKCMAIFFVLGIPCMAYTAYRFNQFKASYKNIAIIVLDVATFLVPPLLPAVLTSINAHSQRRLRKKGIYCLNPNVINCCGGLDLMCFDKTGTLTEDSIDLSGVVPVSNNGFLPPERDVTNLDLSNKLLLAMASCHSLTQHNNKIDGEKLDLKMFESLKWEFKMNDEFIDAFEKPPERIVGPINNEIGSNNIYGIIRQIPFESQLQRMLVVIKQAFKREYLVIVKGAPELIVSFCLSNSLPNEFTTVMDSFTRDGFRVLAAASKVINCNLETVLKLSREELESDLNFDGFLVFQNRLKNETESVLSILHNANIRTVMITGDNLLTSMSVGRECGMIDESDSVIKVHAELHESSVDNPTLRVSYKYAKLPGFSEKINIKSNGGIEEVLLPVLRQSGKYHLAMEGHVFNLIRLYDHNLLDKVIHKGTIFSRMSPQHKLHLIECFQEQGHQVGMCGDGANDCGALRTAHAGVSLSIAEASVASPFTYRKKDISCVPLLIIEGRATLSATIGAFKYQVCYCFVLLAAVLILFWDGSAYVFVDVILNLLPPMVFGTTEGFPKIVKQFPTRSILSFLPQFSMFSFIAFQALLYLLVRQFATMQPWYEQFVYNPSNVHKSMPSQLALCIFSVNMVSYVISAIIFSPGPPFRKDIFSNKLYVGVVLINFGLVSWVVLFPSQFILKFVNFSDIPFHFKLILFTISLANFIFCYIWEVILLQGLLFNLLIPKIRSWRGPIHKYEKIEADICESDGWPPIVTTKSNDLNISETIVGKTTAVTQQPNFWIMRSQSNEDDLNPFQTSLMTNNESPIEKVKPITFTTFMNTSLYSKSNIASKKDSVA